MKKVIFAAIAMTLLAATIMVASYGQSAVYGQFTDKKSCVNHYVSVGNTTKEAKTICNELLHGPPGP